MTQKTKQFSKYVQEKTGQNLEQLSNEAIYVQLLHFVKEAAKDMQVGGQAVLGRQN